MKTLYITVGLPRSGKSTWADKQGIPIVCPDDIRLASHGRAYIPDFEPFVWAITKVMVKALLARHDTVILDATNMTVKRRKQWVDDSWDIVFVRFPVSADECIDRAIKDKRYDLIEVIRGMNETYEFISAYERFTCSVVTAGQDE